MSVLGRMAIAAPYPPQGRPPHSLKLSPDCLMATPMVLEPEPRP